MCSGHTRHIVNGNEVRLEQGELLFLNQHAVQEIDPASEDDIAVNFIILPEFFNEALRMMETEENMQRRFVIDCLRGDNQSAAYLLSTTAMSVMDIGLAVGYENMSYFHRIFQNKYGMTPRRYRLTCHPEPVESRR